MTRRRTRREVLRTAGAGVIFVSSGCVLDRGTAIRIGELAGYNYTTEPHRLHVRLHAGNEVVYARSTEFESAEGRSPGGGTFDDLPEERRDYAISYRLGSRTGWNRDALDEVEHDCLSLGFVVDESASGPDVGDLLKRDCTL